MSRLMEWTGFIATLVMVIGIGVYALFEPARQAAAQASLQAGDIRAATDLYAQNCAICHGAAGEGLGAAPPLNGDGLRTADPAELARVIANGRYNTAMAAWQVEYGGTLTGAQIDQVVTLIQHGDWTAVGARVAGLGLQPPTAVQVEVPADLLAQVSALPGGDALSRGLSLYGEDCVACHGANAEGTAIAPALNTDELRARLADADLARTIAQGVPGTLMAGWGNALSEQEIADLVAVIRRWGDLQTAGLALPAIEIAAAPATPEMIAAGQQLFSVACTNCHGRSAQGTRMAPALYNRTFLSQTPDAAIYQIIANGVPGTFMPAWGGRLSDADLNALVAYLRSLEAAAPAIGAPPAGP